MNSFDESKVRRSTDGKFANKTHAEADNVVLAPSFGNQLTSDHLNPDGTYSHAELVRLTEDGEVEAAARDLRRRFQDATSQWAANLNPGKDSRGMLLYIDVNDFLLRVEEDGATRDPAFLSGEDDRVPYYLGIAVEVAEAPEGQGYRVLTGEDLQPEPKVGGRFVVSPEQVEAAAARLGPIPVWTDEDRAALGKDIDEFFEAALNGGRRK